MPAWILTMVVNFVLRQLAKFSETTDWTKVKADAVARIAKLFPAFMLPGLADIVSEVVDVFAAALADVADLQAVAQKLVAGDVAGALAALLAMVEKLVHTPAQYKVAENLKALQKVA